MDTSETNNCHLRWGYCATDGWIGTHMCKMSPGHEIQHVCAYCGAEFDGDYRKGPRGD